MIKEGFNLLLSFHNPNENSRVTFFIEIKSPLYNRHQLFFFLEMAQTPLIRKEQKSLEHPRHSKVLQIRISQWTSISLTNSSLAQSRKEVLRKAKLNNLAHVGILLSAASLRQLYGKLRISKQDWKGRALPNQRFHYQSLLQHMVHMYNIGRL